MTITLAFGKSIPTSITVVETSISIDLFRKFLRTTSFSSFVSPPWIKPTFFENFARRCEGDENREKTSALQ